MRDRSGLLAAAGRAGPRTGRRGCPRGLDVGSSRVISRDLPPAGCRGCSRGRQAGATDPVPPSQEQPSRRSRLSPPARLAAGTAPEAAAAAALRRAAAARGTGGTAAPQWPRSCRVRWRSHPPPTQHRLPPRRLPPRRLWPHCLHRPRPPRLALRRRPGSLCHTPVPGCAPRRAGPPRVEGSETASGAGAGAIRCLLATTPPSGTRRTGAGPRAPPTQSGPAVPPLDSRPVQGDAAGEQRQARRARRTLRRCQPALVRCEPSAGGRARARRGQTRARRRLEPPLAAALPRQRRPCGARALDAEEPLLASVSRAWWAAAAHSRLSPWPEAAA